MPRELPYAVTMTTKRTTQKDTTIVTAGDREAAADAALAAAIAADAETAWSPAWLADRMALTDSMLTRVQDTPGCCGGMRCMHYVNKPIARVRGVNAPVGARGKAIGLTDALMLLRGRGAQ